MEFKVFTLNCWGLLCVSKHRKARMRAIAEKLAEGEYDVVCLQEVWVDSDWQLIKNKVSGVFPYSHYFYSGYTGSGVCILSRHPIENVFFHQWSVNGYIHKIHHGDWFGGKGVGLCRLRVNNYTVNVYSTHLHAEYNRDSDEYEAHRVLQAFDTAQFFKMTSECADLSVLAGDLNTEPGDVAYRVMLSTGGLLDSYIEAGDVMKDEDKEGTNECPHNSYTPHAQIRDEIPGKRIDYILYHPGSNLQIEFKNYDLPWPHRVPGCAYSYSDHEGVAASFIINKTANGSFKEDAQAKRDVLTESIKICNEALGSLNFSCYLYWFFTFVLAVLWGTTIVMNTLFEYRVIYHILKFPITVLMTYTFIMATVWNKIERHAVVSGKLAMSVALERTKTKEK